MGTWVDPILEVPVYHHIDFRAVEGEVVAETLAACCLSEGTCLASAVVACCRIAAPVPGKRVVPGGNSDPLLPRHFFQRPLAGAKYHHMTIHRSLACPLQALSWRFDPTCL